MSESELVSHLEQKNVAAWRIKLARRIESSFTQKITTGVILFNAVILGVETDAALMSDHGLLLKILDTICLIYFVAEISLKLAAYRLSFWRNGWNCFDFSVVAIALAPGAGAWSVLRSLRVLRILRLLTVVPQLKRVVAAFMHAIPGLSGVIFLMGIFFYTFAVLATKLFGDSFPQWFGSLWQSLYTLFQIMTLESWSMGIVRPIMETYPWAWAIFVPFIVVATFTILNLFIGIIVSTMQELAETSDDNPVTQTDLEQTIARMEADLSALKSALVSQKEKKD
ncbi:MAG: ion transporter [Verrucomicrobiota bacterium]